MCLGCTWCSATMSLEEKVGQILMVHFHGCEANEEARELIQELHVGGIIFYTWSNGLDSPEQVQRLCTGLQTLAQHNRNPIPLLLAVDQEGGKVSRFKSGFTQIPNNQVIALAGDPATAEAAARTIGTELRSVGINMNLAPVVDVNCNPNNVIIGARSFGADPATVVTFGAAALRGYHQAQVLTTLKHYPGHGDVSVDSHHGLPVVNKSLQELQEMELLPFAQLAHSTDAIMTAHIVVPALDADNCATLSEKVLGYLRNTIGFRGVIIADSLVMEGVLQKCSSVDEAAIQALNAGCDILLLGGKLFQGERAGFELSVDDIKRIHTSLVAAVRSGRIPLSRLDSVVERVMQLKTSLTIQ